MLGSTALGRASSIHLSYMEDRLRAVHPIYGTGSMDDSVSQDVLRIGDLFFHSQAFADATNEPDLTFAYGRCSHSMHTVGSVRRYSWPCLQHASPSLRMCSHIYESAYILAVKFYQARPFCQPTSRTSKPFPQHDF
ncbi:hypothetical protein DFH29DRAFT_890963 [Suillus ampliporus]|nr:hypothetical protein DFH29DRAFT_890963 [Suillus ampliporus]